MTHKKGRRGWMSAAAGCRCHTREGRGVGFVPATGSDDTDHGSLRQQSSTSGRVVQVRLAAAVALILFAAVWLIGLWRVITWVVARW